MNRGPERYPVLHKRRMQEAQEKRQPPTFIPKIKLGAIALRTARQLKHDPQMKNWRTTLGGALGAAGPVLKAILPPEWAWIGDASLSIGLALLGKSALDAKNAADKK